MWDLLFVDVLLSMMWVVVNCGNFWVGIFIFVGDSLLLFFG